MDEQEKTARMLANPFYCIEKASSVFTLQHKTMITEEQWISAAEALIAEIGAQAFLKHLLENLKGNYVPDEHDVSGLPFGFVSE